MSAIGDYIHYSAKGYLQHGTSLNGEPNGVGEIFNAQREKTLLLAETSEALNDQERIELEQAIEELMKPSQSDAENQATTELWNTMVAEFMNEFDGITGEISRETGNIRSNGLQVDRIRRKSDNAGIYQSTIIKRIGMINASMAALPSSANKQAFQQQLETIYNQVSELSGITTDILRATGYNFQTKKVMGTQNIGSKKYSWDEAQNVVDAINKLAAKSIGAAGLQKGTLFEYMIAVAPLVGKGRALQELKNGISDAVHNATSHVVGSKGSSVTFDPQDFAAAANLNQILGKNYSYDINQQLYVSNRVATDKVDVEITFRNKPLNVSAKNINLKSGYDIHLVSDTSLLSLLTNEGTDYANHYLNIVAANSTSGGSIPANQINEAHASLRFQALLSALEGYRGAKANIFIVNDNTTGRVRVFNIADLIKAAGMSMDNYSVTANGSGLESMHLINEWNDDGYPGRITNLLASAHAQKIKISLSPNMLT